MNSLSLLSILLIVNISCQTLQKSSVIKLSVEENKLFLKNEDFSNGGDFSLSQGKTTLLKSQLEWAYSDPENYELAVFSSLGNDILRIKSQHGVFEQSSNLSKKGLSIATNHEGFLVFNNIVTTLKSFEFINLLEGQLPYSWKSQVTYKKENIKKSKVYISDKGRKIQVVLSKDKKKEIKKVCVNFSWNIYWFFYRAHIMACYENLKPKKVFINFNDNFFLRLRHDE